MSKHLSVVWLLASIWTTRLLVQGAVGVQDLTISKCRIMGVAIVGRKANPQLDFTQAGEACKVLGLTLASKDQVGAAQKSGFETCSYGWVGERISVIPRIFSNPKCGKNGKGVLIWNAPTSQKFKAYCYNSSDTWVNSCIPEIITTYDPVYDTQTMSTEFSVSNNAHSAPSPNSTTQASATTPRTSATTPRASATTRAPPSTSMARKTKTICITEVYTEPYTIEPSVESRAPIKNETPGFGGVPTTLLVLALLFFGAAAALAVCYVKRYVKAFPFANKNEQKEMIETKVVKEEKADDVNANEESKKTVKNPEEPKSPPKTTVRCLEAEV